jgi:hypothetical protein
MNKLKMIIAVVALITSINAMAQKVTFNNSITIKPGETADLTCSLESSVTAASAQFYIQLPEGISLATDEDDDVECQIGDLLTKKSVVDIRPAQNANKEVIPNTYLFLIYNTGQKAFKQASGTVLTLTLKAASNMTEGAYKGLISKIKFAKLDATPILSTSDGKGYFPDQTLNFTVSKNPTAIRNVTVDKSAKKAGIYTIAGQKLNKITESGVYIVDGKKVAVKK